MSTINASFSRDNNRIPLTYNGIIVPSTNQILTGNNTTVTIPLFHITGTVLVTGLWGVVTTDLGANHTAAYWRINDQAAQANITLNTGTTLSAIKTGSVIVKKGLAGAALTKLDNATGLVSEPTTLETFYFSPFTVVKKTGAVTDIEYLYTTTDAPTSGAITFYAQFLPISSDGALTAI